MTKELIKEFYHDYLGDFSMLYKVINFHVTNDIIHITIFSTSDTRNVYEDLVSKSKYDTWIREKKINNLLS